MKKCGILTFYYKSLNFGGVLQAYALCRAINDNFNNVHAEQISYDYYYKVHQDNKIGLKKAAKQLINKYYSSKFKVRANAFYKFEDSIPHSKNIYNDDNISELNNEYDLFICGGDQIWNEYGSYLSSNSPENFSLQFTEKYKFSYAASMPAKSFTNDFLNRIMPGISKLNAISVREKSSVKLIEKYTNRIPQVIPDPVFLLSQNEWNSISNNINQDYILCYFLGDDINIRKIANQISRKLNLKIITFPYIQSNSFRKSDLFFGDIHDYSSGPAEFVSLIRNAKLVLTDSYHASVLSTIYNKNFYVFPRDSKVMGNRINDFLNEYKLTDRYIDSINNINLSKNIDFTYLNIQLEKNRKIGYQYLNEMLKRM